MGRVSLVGAGPGDPELLTRKAVARLRRANLVLYDALVDDRVLVLARRARRFFVGKRAGRHAISQAEIHALMLRAAKRGEHVVRLKGGDPFVFGRGGEEAQALQRAGVPYEVVPGVTSVVAAPALAGIPLTHRGLASAFFVVSGHDQQVFSEAVAAFRPQAVTIVVVMGIRRRAAIAAHLLGGGWGADTPAAIVSDGTLPQQRTWRGTLGALASGGSDVRGTGPALIIIGSVAGLDLRTTVDREVLADVNAESSRPASRLR